MKQKQNFKIPIKMKQHELVWITRWSMDSFPLWLTALPNLKVITMGSNRFHGLISQALMIKVRLCFLSSDTTEEACQQTTLDLQICSAKFYTWNKEVMSTSTLPLKQPRRRFHNPLKTEITLNLSNNSFTWHTLIISYPVRYRNGHKSYHKWCWFDSNRNCCFSEQAQTQQTPLWLVWLCILNVVF